MLILVRDKGSPGHFNMSRPLSPERTWRTLLARGFVDDRREIAEDGQTVITPSTGPWRINAAGLRAIEEYERTQAPRGCAECMQFAIDGTHDAACPWGIVAAMKKKRSGRNIPEAQRGTVQVKLRLAKASADRLRALAELSGKTTSELVGELVTRWCDGKSKR